MSRNTPNTILENWLATPTDAPKRKQVCHFALRQDAVSLDFHLGRYFKHLDLCLHYFSDFESLVTICQRFPVAAIIIAAGNPVMKELQLLQAIKSNVFLSIIPVILYHPNPDDNDIVAAYENGVEDFIYGEWKDRLVQVRIGRVIDRNRRDLSVNPSTLLPGPAIIEREINRLLALQQEFAMAYADLDNFKAYNDYYGYYRGDRTIQLTARIIKDVVFDLCREGFVGHIAGDDFVFIVPVPLIDQICRQIIRTFQELIPSRYDDVDQQRGFITTTNRRGVQESFSLLTLSIAVLINSPGGFEHVGQMSKMLADLKKAVKLQDGSTYMIERRKPY